MIWLGSSRHLSGAHCSRKRMYVSVRMCECWNVWKWMYFAWKSRKTKCTISPAKSNEKLYIQLGLVYSQNKHIVTVQTTCQQITKSGWSLILIIFLATFFFPPAKCRAAFLYLRWRLLTYADLCELQEQHGIWTGRYENEYVKQNVITRGEQWEMGYSFWY